jgi:predicted metal-dependent peptidase
VHRGGYLQSTRHERLQAAVAIDTSGSTIPDVPQFFGELEGLLRTFGDYEICVMQCDDQVRKVDVFDSDMPAIPSEYDLVGGGGTSFLPVFDHVSAEFARPPSILVYLTDGYGEAPSAPPPYPVLWLLTRDGRIPAPWGDVAFFKGEE